LPDLKVNPTKVFSGCLPPSNQVTPGKPELTGNQEILQPEVWFGRITKFQKKSRLILFPENSGNVLKN
jgi:hypothetical protein